MNTGIKKRYEHIDYTKGMGILLIMLAHVIQNFGPMQGVNSFVRAFHVPVFFIASGYLFAYRYIEVNGIQDRDISFSKIDIGQYIKKRAKVLLIPYVIFSLFNSLLKFAVLYITGGLNKDAINDELVQLLITGNGTVWFLTTLFLTECLVVSLYSIIEKRIKRDNKSGYIYITLLAVVFLICIVIPFYICNENSPAMIILVRVMMALGYYVLGVLFNWKFVVYRHIRSIWCAIVLVILGTATWKIVGCDVDFFNGHFTNPVGSILSSILLSFGTIILLYNLEKSNVLVYITKMLGYFGKNSIIAMLVHPTVLLCITFPLGGWMSSLVGARACIVSIVIFTLLAAAEVPFIWFINKYVPFIIGKRRP